MEYRYSGTPRPPKPHPENNLYYCKTSPILLISVLIMALLYTSKSLLNDQSGQLFVSLQIGVGRVSIPNKDTTL